MIRHGVAPYLECSSKGDIRFSAFYARIRALGGRTVEDLYQCSKVVNGQQITHWRAGKGRKPDNADFCAKYYAWLWDMYIFENPHLLPVLQAASGLSDVFGQDGHNCQATELWRIRGYPK
jgi:hypothetical protein